MREEAPRREDLSRPRPRPAPPPPGTLPPKSRKLGRFFDAEQPMRAPAPSTAFPGLPADALAPVDDAPEPAGAAEPAPPRPRPRPAAPRPRPRAVPDSRGNVAG